MLTFSVLLVGLTLATAVIAYWSDNLGKKLGKKRVSLWGMRPRTTATVLTIASSWLIMVFTLGVLMTVFPLLKRSLLDYQKVKRQTVTLQASKNELDGQVGELNAQLATLTGQTTALQSQVAVASGKLKTVGEKLKQSSEAAKLARTSRDQAQRDANQARKNAQAATKRQQAAAKGEQAARENLGKVRGQLNATRTQREAAEQQLNAAQADLNKANAAVKSADAQVKKADARVKGAERQAQKAETQLMNARGELAQARTDLGQTKRDVIIVQAKVASAKQSALSAGRAAIESGREVIEAQKQVARAEARVARAEARVAALTAQSEQLQNDNEELLRINESLGIDNQNIRDTNFILSQSDVRVPVDSTLIEHSFARETAALDVRRELRAMFDQSATQIVPGLLDKAKLKFDDLPSRDGKRLLTTDEIYDSLVDFIADNPSALSVRLVAARNHLAGESVLESRFLVLPIRQAFSGNFELARVELDGRSGEGPLFSALLDLVDEGTAVAKSKGVKPPLSPDVPNFYVPGSREQIFDALREVKAINGPARVRIVTAQPISTADQLSVKFEVEPIGAITTQATARLAPRALPR